MTMMKVVAFAAGLAVLGAAGAAAAGIDEIDPAVAARLYNKDMLDPAQPVGPSAWRDFVAKNPPPWKIGYASSYAGNTWRAGAMNELQNKIIPEWKALGLLKEVVITQ